MLYYLLMWLVEHHRTPFLEMLKKEIEEGISLERAMKKNENPYDLVFLGSYRELLDDQEAEDVTVFEWRNEEVQVLWFPKWEEARIKWPAKRPSADHVLTFTNRGVDLEGYIDPDYPERVNYREREMIMWLKANVGIEMIDEEMEAILFPTLRKYLPMDELEEVIENLELEIERLKRVVRLYGERPEHTLRDRTRSHGVVKRSKSRRAARKLREYERTTLDEDC